MSCKTSAEEREASAGEREAPAEREGRRLIARSIRPVGLVFATALILRLVHIWQIRRSPFFTLLMGDSQVYDQWAQRLAAGDWVGRDVFYQAPLYPYFLGVLYWVFGRHLMAVRLVQAMIGSISCVLVAGAARRIFSDAAGMAAGLLLALWAPAIFFDGLIQKSALDVFFTALALYLIAPALRTARAGATQRSPRKPQPPRPAPLTAPRSLAIGATLGALALTRENALVLVVVVSIWALLRGGGRQAAALALGASLVLLPVVLRNSVVGGGFYLTTAQFGPNFYIGNNPHADGTYVSLKYGRGSPEYERQDATDLAERALSRPLTPAEVSGYWTSRALDFIRSQPRAWLTLLGRKFVLTWNAAEMVDTEDQRTYAEWSWPLRLLAPVMHFGALVPLALLGVAATWGERRRLWVLYAVVATYAASLMLFYVFARYRYPLVPLLAIFAAAGLIGAPALVRQRPRVRRRTLGLVAAAALFANWPVIPSGWLQAVTENNLGTALQSAQRYDEAIASYRAAIDRRPGYAPAYNNLGTVLRAAGRIDEAIDAYHRALEIQPDFPDAEYNLANALVERGRTDEAIRRYRTALASSPASVEVRTNLGIALAARGQLDEAIVQFRAAVAEDSGSVTALRNLGNALLSRGAPDEGLRRLRDAAQLAPDDGNVQYDLGSALLEAGQAEDAAATLRRATTLLPSSAAAHNNLGIALASSGHRDEAVAEFRTALRLQPDFDDARRNLEKAGRPAKDRSVR